MSNEVKQSLEDNMNEILKALPEEFHADFKASVENAEPSPKLSTDEAKAQAAELMKEDPSIADEECVALLDEDVLINQAIQQPNAEELEMQKKELLAEIEAGLDQE